MSHAAVIYGGAALISYPDFLAEGGVDKALATLTKHHITHIDTAQLYGESEAILGKAHAGDRFVLDTKWGGVWNMGGSGPEHNWAKRERIRETAKESIERLGVDQVDVFYLHYPDPETPLEETLRGVQDAYEKKLFRRFGLSNFSAADVDKAVSIAQTHGWVQPTVYQGNYSAAARRAETELFPTLRRHGMVFRAYSPLAGGLLTKTAEDVQSGKGRFKMGLYKKLYEKPEIIESLARWAAIAEAEGVSKAELAYRWAAYHSAMKPTPPEKKDEIGDALVIGGRTLAQLDESLGWFEKGPLSKTAVEAIDEYWLLIKDVAPLNNIDF